MARPRSIILGPAVIAPPAPPDVLVREILAAPQKRKRAPAVAQRKKKRVGLAA